MAEDSATPERKSVYQGYFGDSLADSAARIQRIDSTPPKGTNQAETWAEEGPRPWLSDVDIAALAKVVGSRKGAYYTFRQALVLVYLLLQKNGVTQYALIARAIGRSERSARDAVNVLTEKGCLASVRRYRYGRFQGIAYEVDALVCQPFLEFLESRPRIRNPHEQDLSHFPKPDAGAASRRRPRARGPGPEGIPRAEELGEEWNDPELRWWLGGKGVDAGQITAWAREFALEEETLRLYLKRCWYYCVHVRTDEPVQHPADYFYRALRQNGFFAEPKGYRSAREIEAEELEAENKRLRDTVARLREAREQREALELERRAEELLANQEDPEFQRAVDLMEDHEKAMPKTSVAFRRCFIDKLRRLRQAQEA